MAKLFQTVKTELNKDGIKCTAVKHDKEKLRVDLLPVEAMEEIAKVFTFGAKKYGDYNWQGGIKYSRLVGASMRHLFAWLKGEDLDPESGHSHLSHLGCNVMMLIWLVQKGRGEDDRKK